MDWQKIEEIRLRQRATDNANSFALRSADKINRRPRLVSEGFISRVEKIRLARLGNGMNEDYRQIDKFLSKEPGNESFRKLILAASRERNRPVND
jgi:hypothetical protein